MAFEDFIANLDDDVDLDGVEMERARLWYERSINQALSMKVRSVVKAVADTEDDRANDGIVGRRPYMPAVDWVESTLWRYPQDIPALLTCWEAFIAHDPCRAFGVDPKTRRGEIVNGTVLEFEGSGYELLAYADEVVRIERENEGFGGLHAI